jgi:hypothetical protein
MTRPLTIKTSEVNPAPPRSFAIPALLLWKGCVFDLDLNLAEL